MSPAPRAVSRIVDTVRGYVNSRARLGLAAWVAAAVAVVLALAWILVGSEGWRAGTPLPLLLDLLIVLALVQAWRELASRRERWLAERLVSRSVERAAGLPRGTVLESLELERAVPKGTSAGLANLAVQQTAAGLTGSPSHLAGQSGRLAEGWARSGLKALAVTAPLTLLALGLAPERAAQAWAGLLRPVQLLAGEVLPPLEVMPGSVEVARGTPVEIDVVAVGREEVTLHWRAVGDVPRSRVGAVENEQARFPFPSVDVAMDYWAQAPDGAVSDVFTLAPADPLLVTDVQVSLTFPPHTGRTAEEYRGVVPRLAIPFGTRLRIVGRASRPLGSAGLEEAGGGTSARFDVSGPSFGGDWTPRRSALYEWTFLDARGERPGVVPAPLDVVLVPDAFPSLRVLYPARDTVIPITRRQPLVVDVRDDYGLDRLEVEAFRGDGPERTVQPLSLGGVPAAIARPLLDLSQWSLVPGDSVLYRVRLIDNSPAGQTTQSDVHILRVPTVSDLRRDAQAELEDAVRRLEELADRARQEAEGARPTDASNRAGDPMEFGDREQARTSLDRQREMSREVEELSAELERLAAAMQDGGLADQDLQKDLQELQELLNEMNSDDLVQQMQDLEESLSEEDARRAMEELRQMMENQEEFRQMLEESLERFRRAAVEQDFRATREEAEELARRERALAEALREQDNPELRNRQQAALEAEAETLQQRMERLQDNLGELGEQVAQRSAQEASTSTEQARQSMREASEAQSGEQAGERAEQAADQLQQAAEALEQAQDRMAEELTKQVQAALQQTAEGALALAERQAELRDQMRGATREEMADLRSDQAAVTEGARNMSRNLEEGLRFSPMDAPGVSELIDDAQAESERTAEALGRRGSNPSPAASADRTVHALNRLAMSAMNAADQVAQASAQQQAGGEQSQEQMDQLAEQQADLMNQSAQMMPMQLSQQAMAQQMQQMAQGQQAVASDLGEMSNDPGGEQSMADMEAMAQEAQAIAELLAGGRLDRETLERQERLFHRLLEAGRSLEREEDEESEERQSEAPGEFERGQISPLTDADLGRARFPLPSAAFLARLTPGERRLVLQYFERLNRPPGEIR